MSSLVGPVEQVALVPVLEAQHLRAVGVVAPGLARQRSADWMVGISISIAPARSCSSRTICSIFFSTRWPSGSQA